jgi:hypothetical protein
MARPKNPVPTYKHHKPTDTARCWINGAWISLGKYNSPESRQAHTRLSVEEASKFCGISKSVARDDCDKRLPSTKPRRLRLIPKRALVLYLAKHLEGEIQPLR